MATIRDDDYSHVLIGTAGDDVIFGNGGNDTIRGGDGNDRIVGGSGADVASGGAGDDTIIFYGASHVYYVGEVINGGTGSDTLLLSSAGSAGALQFNFYNTSLSSIERLQLNSGLNDIAANFYLDPLHPVQFSPRLEVMGGVGKDSVNFHLGDSANLDLRGAAFTNWQSEDELNIHVTGSKCTVGGTGQADDISINIEAWGSLVKGNEGNDVFHYMASMLVTIDGGAGQDCIVVNDFGSFFNTWLVGIEEIRFENSTQTSRPYAYATFDSAAFDVGAANPFLHFVDASNMLPSAVSIFTNAYDGDTRFSAAHFTFENWDSADCVFIFGNSSNDTIVGSVVNDQVFGWTGADRLLGGAGNDTFGFSDIADSGVGYGFRDRIVDFSGGDKIDLSALDANATLAGDQAFALDTDGVLAEGEIQFAGHLNTVIRVNLDADPEADMEMVLVGVAPGSLSSSDFIL